MSTEIRVHLLLFYFAFFLCYKMVLFKNLHVLFILQIASQIAIEIVYKYSCFIVVIEKIKYSVLGGFHSLMAIMYG